MLDSARPGLGIGVDLVDVACLARKLAISPGLLHRTFTAAERGTAVSLNDGRRNAFLAGRFAAKEAVLKAFGVGITGELPLTDIEVSAADSGAPTLILHDAALRAAEERGFATFTVSISHDGGFAVAFVVLTH